MTFVPQIALTSLSNAADREKAMENGGPSASLSLSPFPAAFLFLTSGDPVDAWEIKGGKSLKTIVAELAALQLSL